jgi:hypothetical protein
MQGTCRKVSCVFMNSSPRENHGIARIELAVVGSYGWQVRLQRRGQKVSRFFADRIFGGADASLQAARQWRDDQRELWSKDDSPRTCVSSPRNASGVVGVSRVIVRSGTGAVYHFWQATWCPAPGQRQSVKFSVKKHGDHIAYRLAIEARRMGIGGGASDGDSV